MPDAYTQIPRSQNSEGRLMAGVASAAVVSGELIIGLDDGRIIRAGYVQGPTGLTGPEGAVGATGQRGRDGNTILSGAEKPKPEAGKEGDFWINTRDWFIYGPKTSGQWGTGTYMLGPKEYLKNNRSNQGGGGTAPSTEPGGGTGTVYSNTVYLTGTGRVISAPGGNIIPEGLNLSVQSNLNQWIENSLRALDTKLPVAVVDSLPGTGQYEGDLVLFEGKLYVWAGSEWVKVTSDGGAYVGPTPPIPAEEGRLWFCNDETDLTLYINDGAVWVPASPPVSLDGIEQHTMELEANVQALWKSSVPFDVFQPYAQKIDLLETELDKLEGVFIDVNLTYKFGYAPQRAPEPGAAYLRYGDDSSSQKPTYEQAHWLNVSNVDRAGNPIDWASVVAGNEITIENLDGSGFGIYKCYDPVVEAENWIKIQLVLDPDVEENNEGKPVENELVRIKCSDSAGLSNYVRKSGDTMNGTLNISNVPESQTGDGPLKLYGLKKSPTNDDIITAPIFQGGHVPTGSFLQYTGRTSNKSDLVNKGYVDNKAQTNEIKISGLIDDSDPELVSLMAAYSTPTQDDLNNAIGQTFFNQRRKTTRTTTNLDIIQSTVADGQWNFVKTDNPGTELPQIGEFLLIDGDGQWTQEWAKARTLRINGGDGRATALSEVRRGTQWIFQDVVLNTFAHYITKDVEFTGSVEGGQFVVEAVIEPIKGRAVGVIPEGTVCEVKTILPRPCITTKDGSKPVVDDDGYLWYDEKNQKLFVSDWDDDQEANGEAQWIEVGSGGGAVTGDYVSLSGENTVSNGWKIQSDTKSHFHVDGDKTKIYWLQDPSHAQHPVTMGWADNKYAQASNLSSYLPIKGGQLTGNLSFASNTRIDCNNSNTVLSGRGCFELRAAAAKPLIFSSGSGSNRLLSFYGYDGEADDKRSEKAYITAGGNAHFKKVYSNEKELATKEYVDANAGGSSEGAIAKSGTDTNPTLAKGELYLCTTDNTLRVGV